MSEATRDYKAAPRTRHIPIVALTAHTNASDRETPGRGCDDFDTKPIELRAVQRSRPCSIRDLGVTIRSHH